MGVVPTEGVVTLRVVSFFVLGLAVCRLLLLSFHFMVVVLELRLGWWALRVVVGVVFDCEYEFFTGRRYDVFALAEGFVEAIAGQEG